MQATRVPSDWPVPSLFIGKQVLGNRITYAGLDVHVGIVVAPAEDGLRGEVRDYGRIANTPAAVQRLVASSAINGWSFGSAMMRRCAVTDANWRPPGATSRLLKSGLGPCR